MMLKSAFNALTRLNSRPAQLKRLGSPDIYSPCRIAASNYFRFLRGPEHTVIHGREFILPIDTMAGHFMQTISFSDISVAGTYKIQYGTDQTTDLNFDDAEAVIQTALRLVPLLQDVLVTVISEVEMRIVFPGFASAPTLLSIADSTLEDDVAAPITSTTSESYSVWSNRLRRGDRVIDSVYGVLTIDEIVEMTDIGGAIMGFRIHCE